jgi:hypothetical protein
MNRLILFFVLLFLTACSHPTSVTSKVSFPQYHPGVQLPPTFAPGAVNPEVTQDNISDTICAPHWTSTIRPRPTYTTKIKLLQINSLNLTGQAADFEEDHRVPLEVGGNPTDERNLWPEPWPQARLKDRLESAVKRDVCAGRITLKEGQSVFLGDFWVDYEKRYGAPTPK